MTAQLGRAHTAVALLRATEADRPAYIAEAVAEARAFLERMAPAALATFDATGAAEVATTAGREFDQRLAAQPLLAREGARSRAEFRRTIRSRSNKA